LVKKKSFKKFPYPRRYPNHHQNQLGCSKSHIPPFKNLIKITAQLFWRLIILTDKQHQTHNLLDGVKTKKNLFMQEIRQKQS